MNHKLSNKSKNGYDKDKMAVNEYIKQLLIRKYPDLLTENGITDAHFAELQNTNQQTLSLAKSHLNSSNVS